LIQIFNNGNQLDHRDEPGYNANVLYTDTTDWNDIVLVKVARNTDNVYFFARTNRLPRCPTY